MLVSNVIGENDDDDDDEEVRNWICNHNGLDRPHCKIG